VNESINYNDTMMIALDPYNLMISSSLKVFKLLPLEIMKIDGLNRFGWLFPDGSEGHSAGRFNPIIFCYLLHPE
jgi:hypothetical protein